MNFLFYILLLHIIYFNAYLILLLNKYNKDIGIKY